MANAAAIDNCFLDQSYDDFNVDEFSNIDSSLVMSLLQDSSSQAEDGDDEMVRLMIQSLEPDQSMNQYCSSSSETSISDDGYRFCEDEVHESCSTSPDQFEWINDMEVMAYNSCPSHDITDYFVGRFMAEHEGLEDYSQAIWYDQIQMPMEEDDYIGLWQ